MMWCMTQIQPLGHLCPVCSGVHFVQEKPAKGCRRLCPVCSGVHFAQEEPAKSCRMKSFFGEKTTKHMQFATYLNAWKLQLDLLRNIARKSPPWESVPGLPFSSCVAQKKSLLRCSLIHPCFFSLMVVWWDYEWGDAWHRVPTFKI